MLKRALQAALRFGLIGAITLACVEVSLRAAPRVIPLGLLARFQPKLRSAIAERLGLPRENQTTPLGRDDGGPILKLFEPFSIVADTSRDGERSGPVTTDKAGFCNPAAVDYDRARFDVIALGDSFTWCLAVSPEATWPARLAETTGLAVYNLGRFGVGPYEYLQILKKFGLPKRPRAVVMNLYEGNDLRDAVRFHEYVAAAARGEAPYAEAADRGASVDYAALLDNALGRNSYAYDVLAILAARSVGWIERASRDRTAGETDAYVDFRYELVLPGGTLAFNRENGDQSEVRSARLLRAGRISPDALSDALASFADLARREGFRAVVLYTPSAYTAYAAAVRFADPELAELMPWYSATLRDFLRAKSGELGYVSVDATPQLQAAAQRPDNPLLYFPVNLHLTSAGHRVVAGVVAAALADLGS